VSAEVLERPAGPEFDDGGIPARLAITHWAWRLFRREWRQQLLVMALLTVAVAATVWGAGVATNTPPANPNAGTYGTASALISLPGTDPHLAADIAAIRRQYGPADVIENQGLVTGTVQAVWLRAQDPAGPYGGPLLAVVSGHYPAGPGQAAMTGRAAALYRVRIGSSWHADGRTWRVTGIVENPSNLLDDFALVSPGQLTAPTRVTILVGASHIQGLPAAASVSYPSPPPRSSAGISPATIVLAVALLGLIFIGLVAVAGFTVMAQRRLRALGMLSALGATEANVRLVMAANGALVGVIGAGAGAVIGFGAWLAYAPHLQALTAHTVDPLNLPWWAIILAMVLAVVTATAAAVQPARAVARIPVVAALSGRRAQPKTMHRPARLGTGLLVAGVFFLAISGGGGSQNSGSLLLGLAAIAIGMSMLAPLCVAVLTCAAGPRVPVAVRIALRDLVRNRARSGAALAATSFTVFLAVLICVIASVRFSNVLDWTGPNLTTSQLIIYTSSRPSGPGAGVAPTQAQLSVLHANVDSLAASLHARAVLALDEAGTVVPAIPGRPASLQGATLTQAGRLDNNFSGPVYVATPALLAQYGIKPGRVSPATDILTMRPGLASLSGMYLIWGTNLLALPGTSCQSGSCVASPPMQTFGALPGGTSAPNTVLTMQAVHRLHLPLIPYGWLIQTPRPLTSAQISAARQLAVSSGGTIETKSGELGLGEISDGATAFGILIALGVLVMTVGLIRSESASDLRTLTAAGASRRTRRTIVGATAGAIGLLGAVLGTAGATIAAVAWAKSSPSATFGGIPPIDLLLILAGLPIVAAAGGWLLAGREPSAIARQPLE
jgi:putative ABC transport system permease protein